MIDDERGTSPDDLDFGALVDDALSMSPALREHVAESIRHGSTLSAERAAIAARVLDDRVVTIEALPPMSEGARETFAHLAALQRPLDLNDPISVRAHLGPLPTVISKRLDVQAPSAPTIDHASYLGASDIGAILGLDPMRTPLDVWAEKTRRVPYTTSTEAEAGNDHESAVVAGAVRRLKRAGVYVQHEYPGPGTIVSAESTPHPDPSIFLPRVHFRRGATLDAIVHHREHGRCALEAKLVGAGMADAWGPEPAGPEGIPIRTLVQVHWQTMHARERFPGSTWPVAFVAADIAGTDRRLYEIPISDTMIAELLEAGREWWRAHVLGDVMPEPTGADVETLAAIFPHVERRGLNRIPPSGLRELAEEYVVGREITIRHRDELARVGAKIRALIGSAEGYVWNGGKVTWREDAAGDRRLLVRVWRNE